MRHRFNPRKRVKDYQRYSMLTVLPLSFMSRTLGNSSSLQAAGDDHSCRYYNPLSAKKDIWKNFFSIWWWQNNVIVKTCLNQKIIKISNLIQAMKSSVCPKAKVMRMPNFSESRICPNIYRMFRGVDWTHDMIIVKWHLFIWHERKLCALTNAPPVQSTQIGRWLSTLFHASCSAAQVYVLHPGQYSYSL